MKVTRAFVLAITVPLMASNVARVIQTNSAPAAACRPIAVEMAIRIPAYEPGPSPITIFCGNPNS